MVSYHEVSMQVPCAHCWQYLSQQLLCWLEHFKRPYFKEPLSRHHRKFCLYIRELKGLLREHSTVIIKVQQLQSRQKHVSYPPYAAPLSSCLSQCLQKTFLSCLLPWWSCGYFHQIRSRQKIGTKERQKSRCTNSPIPPSLFAFVTSPISLSLKKNVFSPLLCNIVPKTAQRALLFMGIPEFFVLLLAFWALQAACMWFKSTVLAARVAPLRRRPRRLLFKFFSFFQGGVCQ